MAARMGFGRVTIVDPDTVAIENIGRHILTTADVGRPKVEAVRDRILAINPECRVDARQERFDPAVFSERRNPLGPPDIIVSSVDSFRCESAINAYSLSAGVPAVYGGAWGAAVIGEILYVVPGKTPCYECYAGFRRTNAEIPNDPRRYTDPNFDSTQVPGQPGIWPNILAIAGLEFQVILGLLGLRPVIDYEHSLWLVNVSDYDSPLQPFAVTFGTVKRGCPVCDDTSVHQLGERFEAEFRNSGIQDTAIPAPPCSEAGDVPGSEEFRNALLE